MFMCLVCPASSILVAVALLNPGRCQAGKQIGVQVAWDRRRARCPRTLEGLAHQPPVGAACGE